MDGSRNGRGARAASAGRVVFWEGGSLWLSEGTGEVATHSHHALQLVLVPAGRARVLDADAQQWHCGDCLLVQAGHRHSLDGQGQALAVLFVAPESRAGQALQQRGGGHSVAALAPPPGLLAAVAALLTGAQQGDAAALAATACGLVDQLAAGDDAGRAIDARVQRVLAWLEQAADGPVTLAQAAAVAGLSPSRLRHLFVAQTGIPLRTYLLWRRLNRALARGIDGMPWAMAAQCSGFADQAHLTRTCRRMIGLVPSMLARPVPPARG